MKQITMVAIILFIGTKTYAQLQEDILSFNYGLAPIGHDNIDFYKTDFQLNLPITLQKGLLTTSIGFENYQINYTKDYSFSTGDISKLYNINYALKYILPLQDTWELSVMAKAAIASNLTSKLTANDFLYTGEAQFKKVFKNTNTKTSLAFGASYNTITGKPNVLPIISYYKEVNQKLSIEIGFPKTLATYKLSDVSTLQSAFTLNGFYANLSSPMVINASNEIEKASFSATSLGLEYQYLMDDYWAISFKGGYALSNNYKLLDANNATVYNFNTVSKPFFSAGLTFSLKNQNKK